MANRDQWGEFELTPGERSLRSNGLPVTLGARAFDLLVALVERHGEVQTKDDLMARVWPGVVVEENNLAVQVSALRKLLGPGRIGLSNALFPPQNSPHRALEHTPTQLLGPAATC